MIFLFFKTSRLLKYYIFFLLFGYSAFSQPAAPTATPATNRTNTSFRANWTSVSGATYRLDVSLVSDFSSFVGVYNNLQVNSTNQNITGLSSGTTYYYRVRAVVGAQTSANSNTITAITVPVAPTSKSATVLTSGGFQANWSAVTGGTSYRLDVSTTSNFNNRLPGYNPKTTSDTNFIVTGLTANTTYYYRVRAVTSTDSSSNSNTITVLTLLNPPTPNPAINVISNSFTASWGSVSGASSYRLDVASDPDFLYFVSGYENRTVSTTSQSVTGLSPNYTYYYRVRSINGSGPSLNSSTIMVITSPEPPTPLLSTNITSNSFTANWSAASGAISYHLDVSTQRNFSTYVINYQNKNVINNFDAVIGLAAGTKYYFRIRSDNGTSVSENSNIDSVITIPPPPVLQSPVNNAVDINTSVNLQWLAASGATGYNLQVANDTNFTAIIYDLAGLTAVTYPLSGLNQNTKYFWRVSAGNSNGISEWSTIFSFFTISPDLICELVSPVSNTLSRTIIEPGQSLSIRVRVKNQGSADCGVTNLRYYLSLDQNIDQGTDILLGQNPISALGVGSVVTDSLVIGSFPSWIHGDAVYYLGFIADAENIIIEKNESNNILSPSSPKLTVLYKPDLTIDINGTFSPNPIGPGFPMALNINIINQGLDTTAINCVLAYYLSTDMTLSSNDIFLGAVQVDTISPGTCRNRIDTLKIPKIITGGSYYLIARLDSNNKISEYWQDGESNNIRVFAYPRIDVLLPDLYTSYGWFKPEETGPGDTITLVAWVRNREKLGTSDTTTLNYYLSTSSTLSSGNIFIGSKKVPYILSSAIYKDTSRFPIPSVTSGFYYVGCIIDPVNNLREDKEDNNKLVIDNNENVRIRIDRQITINTVDSYFYPTIVGDDESVTIHTIITNFSTTTQTQNLRYKLISSYDTNPWTYYTSDLGNGPSITLAPGERREIDYTYTFTGSSHNPFSHFIGWDWGSSGQRFGKTRPKLVHTHSDVVIHDTSSFFPTEISAGEQLRINVRVRNKGGNQMLYNSENRGFNKINVYDSLRFYLSTDEDITTDDILIYTMPVPNLPAKAFFDSTVYINNFPDTRFVGAGTYYIGWLFKTTNNIPFHIYPPYVLNVTSTFPDLKPDVNNTGFSLTAKSPYNLTVPVDSVILGDSLILQNLYINNISTSSPFIQNPKVDYFLVPVGQENSAWYNQPNYHISTDVLNLVGNPINPVSSRIISRKSVEVPFYFADGNYYVGVWVNGDNIEAEANYVNNYVFKNRVIKVSSMIFTINPSAAVMQASAPPKSIIEVPIKIMNLNNVNANSFSFTITYDSTVIKPLNEVKGGTRCSNWNFNTTILKPGELYVEGTSCDGRPISDTGSMVSLKFNTIGSTGDYSKLEVTKFLFNSKWLVNVKSGGVRIVNPTNVSKIAGIPETYKLEQCYPNPFNPSTRIRYAIPEESFVTVKIYDAVGREVKILLEEKLKPGWYESEFNAQGFSSGLYFYRIQAIGNTEKFIQIKKALLIK